MFSKVKSSEPRRESSCSSSRLHAEGDSHQELIDDLGYVDYVDVKDEPISDNDDPLYISPATAVRKKGKHNKKPRNNFSIPAEAEDCVFEWLRDHALLWRRGHRHFKDTDTKKALWEAKGKELNVSAKHLQGWWRGMQSWYVKLKKLEITSTEPKRYTDRERQILESCAFYEGELRHRRVSAPTPVKALARAPQVQSDADADSEEDSCHPMQAELDELEQIASRSSKDSGFKRSRASDERHSTKKSRLESDEGQCLREMCDIMKTNTQLLAQIVGTKPTPSGREPFIRYVTDTLMGLPAQQYEAMRRDITSVLHGISTAESSSTAASSSTSAERPLGTGPIYWKCS